MGSKFWGGVTINQNRERYGRHTTHDGLDKSGGKTHSYKSFFQESPLNSIIGFSHVKLNSHIAMFSRFRMLEVVKGFIGNKSVICDKTPRKKSTLLRADDVIKDGFDSIGYSFSDNFKHNIT
jgi:hypothetical protein